MTEAGEAGAGRPSEEELRAELEREIRKLRVQDLLLESTASLLNLAARRIAKEDERDLEQARVGIEAVRRLAELLDPEPARQVREALSQVQVMFARQASAPPGGSEESEDAGPGAEVPSEDAARESQAAPEGRRPRGPGLWTPPGSV
jgi:hypothetical protein